MKILICGVGSLGSRLAECLVPDLKGQHEIVILDRDKVEERNLNIQFFLPDQVGMSKVEALQYNLYKHFSREVGIKHMDVKEIEGQYDLIVDCLDNHDARQIVQNLIHITNHIPLLHVGLSDKKTFEISWAKNYSVPTDLISGWDICEEEGMSSFVQLVSALTSQIIQHYLSTGEKKEFIGNTLTIREIK